MKFLVMNYPKFPDLRIVCIWILISGSSMRLQVTRDMKQFAVFKKIRVITPGKWDYCCRKNLKSC